MLAGYADVRNWGDFDGMLAWLSICNPVYCEQRVRRVRHGSCDNALIESDISEQIVG